MLCVIPLQLYKLWKIGASCEETGEVLPEVFLIITVIKTGKGPQEVVWSKSFLLLLKMSLLNVNGELTVEA